MDWSYLSGESGGAEGWRKEVSEEFGLREDLGRCAFRRDGEGRNELARVAGWQQFGRQFEDTHRLTEPHVGNFASIRLIMDESQMRSVFGEDHQRIGNALCRSKASIGDAFNRTKDIVGILR